MADAELYDTTLRDGGQRKGISFSAADKLRVVRGLDHIGVPYIEMGWPASNPKEREVFRLVQELNLSQAAIVACGAVRGPRREVEKDPEIRALLASRAKIVTLVGKSWDFQVTDILETTLEENIKAVSESIGYLVSLERVVFFDAEHFFDGFKDNAEYALRVLETAFKNGASRLILCDTNGGSLPDQIKTAVKAVRSAFPRAILGIHAHNDCGLAVANTLAAVSEGVFQIQGTINGYGERCGNANFCTLIPVLQLKMGFCCISGEQLASLTKVSRFVAEVANLSNDNCQPFVGGSAFAHKAGLHALAFSKKPESYQHIDPALVGNESEVLVSEFSGKSNILAAADKFNIIGISGETAKKISERIKELESLGFHFEAAGASLELLMRRAKRDYIPPFELISYEVKLNGKDFSFSNFVLEGGVCTLAGVVIKVAGKIIETGLIDGNGPVNAIDKALRQALNCFYPTLDLIELTDYKVRIVEGSHDTKAIVRVLAGWKDGSQEWWTTGCSENIIEASFQALVDGFEYWLLKK